MEKENRGIDISSLSNSDERSSLSLKILLRTGIEPFSIAGKVTFLRLHQRCWYTQTWTVEIITDLNSSGARLFQNNLIGMLLLHHTGIELTSIVSRATMLPLPQRCSSIPIWKEEKSRLLNSFVTGFSGSFCQRYRFCVVRESNPCQDLEKLLCYHFINDASQLLREKKKAAGFTTHLYQKLMKKFYSA